MSKSFFFFSVLILISSTVFSQSTVTIRAGALLAESHASGPIYRPGASSNMDFSQYAYLYTAAELNAIPAGSLISSIAFNKVNNGATTLNGGGKLKIYLKNSTTQLYNASFDYFSRLINGATLVYSNNETTIPAAPSFLNLPLNAPFVYTGGNLEVMVDWDISAVAGSPTTSGILWERTTVARKIYGWASAVNTNFIMYPAGDSTGDITNTRPVVRFTLGGALPACTEPPTAGTVTAPDSVCMGVNTVLTVAEASGGNNTSQQSIYQWQSSPDNSNWTNIGSSSDDSVTISQYTASWYRRIIHCGAGSDITDAKFIDVKPYGECVCIPLLSNVSCFGGYISRVQLGSLDHSSGCTPGSYINYSDSVEAPLFYTGSSKFISITLAGTNSSNQYVSVWIDFDHSGTFNEGRYFLAGTGPNPTVIGTITVPATAKPGLTRMRVRYVPATGGADACEGFAWTGMEIEDYLINIADAAACTAAPENDITVASLPAVCASDSILLSTSGVNDAATTFSYQWQSSADSIVWQDIMGFKNATCVVYQNSARFYRVRIGCAGQYIHTTPVKVDMKPMLQCYCKLPVTSCSGSDYIRRVVFGTIDNLSLCGFGGYTDYSGIVAPPTIQSGMSVPISVTVPAGGIGSYVNVWIDYNMNGEFETNEHTFIGSGSSLILTNNINIPQVAQGGLTRMRVRFKSSANLNNWDACNTGTYYGETEDYIINLAGPKHCIPSHTTSCNTGDVINRVVFGSIDTTTACSANGFGDFTKGLQKNSIEANSYVPLSVQVGCNSNRQESIGVWIDFDQDGLYERSEFTMVGRGDCGTTYSANISIPTNALDGLTTMRIRTTSDTVFNPHFFPGNACLNYANGETEEYNVMVQPYTACPVNYWTGTAGDSNWDNAANWSCQQVPGVHSNVVINSGTVIVGSNVTIYSLTVNPSATLTVIPSFNLTVMH